MLNLLPPTSAAVRYATTELEFLDGTFPYLASSMNDSGQVVGISGRAGSPSLIPTSWPNGPTPSELAVGRPYAGAAAEGITPDGAALGFVTFADQFYGVPVIWAGAAAAEVLPLPQGIFGTAELGSGSITLGTAFRVLDEDGNTDKSIVIWHDRRLAAQINLPGDEGFTGINSHGVFVGSYVVDNRYHAFMGKGTEAHEITFGTLNQPSCADITDDGTILGNYSPDDVNYKGLIEDTDGDIRIFEPLPGYTSSPVRKMNEHGEVVGVNWNDPFNQIATYYAPGSSIPVDLNTMVELPSGVILTRGIDIKSS